MERKISDLIVRLNAGTREERICAALELGECGPGAGEVIPVLLEMSVGDIGFFVAKALSAIVKAEKPMLPALIKDLSEDSELSYYAECALAGMGTEAQPAVPVLIMSLKSEDAGLRVLAAHALNRIVPDIQETVPVCVNLLKSQPKWIRCYAAIELGMLGTRSKPAIPVLCEMLEDTDIDVCHCAATALDAISSPEIGHGWHPFILPALPFELDTSVTVPHVAVPELISLLKHPDKAVRANSATYLGYLGARAIEAAGALKEILKDNESNIYYEAAIALGKISPNETEVLPVLLGLLEKHTGDMLYLPIELLGKMGPAAKKATPALIDVLRSDNPYYICAEADSAIAAINPVSKADVPALIVALKSSDEHTRWCAIMSLGRIASNASDAIPALFVLLNSSDRTMRYLSALALSGIDPYAPGLVSVLAEALACPNLWIRHSAACALGKLGPEAKDAVPALIDALGEQTVVRIAAIDTLSKIGTPANTAIPALIELLHGSVDGAPLSTLEMLGGTLATYAEGATRFMSALKTCDQTLKLDVIRALGKIGAKSPEMLDFWCFFLGDPDDILFSLATSALGDMRMKTIAPALSAFLSDSNVWVRYHVAKALVRIYPDNEDVLPVLHDLAVNADYEAALRFHAADILWQCGITTTEVVPLLVEALSGNSDYPVLAAAELLAKIEPESKAAMAVLVGELESGDMSRQIQSAIAISRVGPNAKTAAPALLPLLESADTETFIAATEALGQIGADARPAVLSLVKALAARAPVVHRHIAEALGKIGSAAFPAVPALLDLLASSANQHVRLVAAIALSKIAPDRCESVAALEKLA